MSSEINELRDSARQVMDGSGLAAAENESWALLGELGWLMVSVPEEAGGLGMGLEAACALQIEMGRGLATAPYLSALMSIEAVSASGAASELLENLMAGADYVAASLADNAVQCSASGDGVTLSATLCAVPSADKASHILVSSDEVLALVPADSVTLTATATWDTTRRLFEVELEGVDVPASGVLARGADAEAIAAKLAVLRDFSLAADAAGGAAALLDVTVEYLQTRRQFGRPLALFQALKHRCADLKAQVVAAEALLLDNLGRLGGGNDALLAQAARELACTVYTGVGEESLQLHGGIGMTSEHVCHLFLKRAMLDEHLGAPVDSYPQALAAALLEASA
ncbi:acyl-CoA dehydrogenase [Mangrovimicrobium sediminis]|uniref:Acyl-CoA dehydrogenase n=1 Tax=Mangrovimicrobium sediminis TaxID=2562682 RepID=A0A4Z0LVM9_9GAMM|nr:acyl-CoA dehydrogenase family protein [Haliea sp. SAOS-164]TGD71329.1 acyl-CoA dehydrogenase [Haliea sp. SAOS-164]